MTYILMYLLASVVKIMSYLTCCQVASEPANAVAARGNRGDFLAAVSLSQFGVGELAKSYHDHWTEVTGQLVTSLRPLLYTFDLPVMMDLVNVFKEKIEEFTHGGVFSLWTSLSNYTSESFNVVALTDTGVSS